MPKPSATGSDDGLPRGLTEKAYPTATHRWNVFNEEWCSRHPSTRTQSMHDLLYLPILAILVGFAWTIHRAYQADNPVLGGNATASLVATLIPLLFDVMVEPLTGVALTIGPVLPLWIAIAGGLHTIGMTTIYERVWWWDHLTHLVSATLIAAVVYGALIAIEADPATTEIAPGRIVELTIVITLVAGIFWEIIELVGRDIAVLLDREPMLVPYGRYDTALDLVVDVVGAVLVIAVDLRVFQSLAEQSPDTAKSLLIIATGAMMIGGLVLSLALYWYHFDGFQ